MKPFRAASLALSWRSLFAFAHPPQAKDPSRQTTPHPSPTLSRSSSTRPRLRSEERPWALLKALPDEATIKTMMSILPYSARSGHASFEVVRDRTRKFAIVHERPKASVEHPRRLHGVFVIRRRGRAAVPNPTRSRTQGSTLSLHRAVSRASCRTSDRTLPRAGPQTRGTPTPRDERDDSTNRSDRKCTKINPFGGSPPPN